MGMMKRIAIEIEEQRLAAAAMDTYQAPPAPYGRRTELAPAAAEAEEPTELAPEQGPTQLAA